ncbi:hypothetical protein BN1232_03187 [Mycobacterium lentiflavum]|uniref:Transmembrane protein n=1 Tax=Mycobacterium lentiflavum TaxID=141349 RepID=A0A0E4CNP3_MYCLN|nr:hypothetical protein [Mycobacterium lentiflavum]CQD14970.1 hypothetical protein BN1232_03187 [Mycobacterium lentiflavum]
MCQPTVCHQLHLLVGFFSGSPLLIIGGSLIAAMSLYRLVVRGRLTLLLIAVGLGAIAILSIMLF